MFTPFPQRTSCAPGPVREVRLYEPAGRRVSGPAVPLTNQTGCTGADRPLDMLGANWCGRKRSPSDREFSEHRSAYQCCGPRALWSSVSRKCSRHVRWRRHTLSVAAYETFVGPGEDSCRERMMTLCFPVASIAWMIDWLRVGEVAPATAPLTIALLPRTVVQISAVPYRVAYRLEDLNTRTSFADL